MTHGTLALGALSLETSTRLSSFYGGVPQTQCHLPQKRFDEDSAAHLCLGLAANDWTCGLPTVPCHAARPTCSQLVRCRLMNRVAGPLGHCRTRIPAISALPCFSSCQGGYVWISNEGLVDNVARSSEQWSWWVQAIARQIRALVGYLAPPSPPSPLANLPIAIVGPAQALCHLILRHGRPLRYALDASFCRSLSPSLSFN